MQNSAMSHNFAVMDGDRLYLQLRKHLNESHMEIKSFKFLDRYLSPVRDQGLGGQCGFVAAITSMEMVHRILAIDVHNWLGPYFFNIDDIFSNIYYLFRGHPEARQKKDDVFGITGTNISLILDFIKMIGLKASAICKNPEQRDQLAHFDGLALRYTIDSYEMLERDQVVQWVKKWPIISVMLFHKSFMDCRTVVYDGPNESEKTSKAQSSHAVVIVGSFEIEARGGYEQYVILQNSYGPGFGFLGFVAVKFDHMFVEFWKVTKTKMTDVEAHKRNNLAIMEQGYKGGTYTRR